MAKDHLPYVFAVVYSLLALIYGPQTYFCITAPPHILDAYINRYLVALAAPLFYTISLISLCCAYLLGSTVGDVDVNDAERWALPLTKYLIRRVDSIFPNVHPALVGVWLFEVAWVTLMFSTSLMGYSTSVSTGNENTTWLAVFSGGLILAFVGLTMQLISSKPVSTQQTAASHQKQVDEKEKA